VVAQFTEAEHSRMPIYRETLDDPVGVVHVKDVFRLLAADDKRPASDRPVVLHRLRREALYVPASMRAADLLLRMRTSRIHMALVIDEFGGTDGLVTMEDLIEAVVGEIDDEHDDAQVSGIVARPGGVFEVDARAPLEELEAALDRDLAPPDMEEDIDTVAGLVVALAGRVPQRGEVIAHPGGFDLEVVEADPRRVRRIRVRPAAARRDGRSPVAWPLVNLQGPAESDAVAGAGPGLRPAWPPPWPIRRSASCRACWATPCCCGCWTPIDGPRPLRSAFLRGWLRAWPISASAPGGSPRPSWSTPPTRAGWPRSRWPPWPPAWRCSGVWRRCSIA
jgi:Mg2+/Co2+ transporter CorC